MAVCSAPFSSNCAPTTFADMKCLLKKRGKDSTSQMTNNEIFVICMRRSTVLLSDAQTTICCSVLPKPRSWLLTLGKRETKHSCLHQRDCWGVNNVRFMGINITEKYSCSVQGKCLMQGFCSLLLKKNRIHPEWNYHTPVWFMHSRSVLCQTDSKQLYSSDCDTGFILHTSP